MNGHDHIETDTSGIAPLLETLGGRGTAGEAPRAFIGRVRRRRLVRRATRAAAVLAVVLTGSVGFMIMNPSAPRSDVWTYSDVQWPPMPELNTGGPVLPIRAGIRATDPMAISLLQ